MLLSNRTGVASKLLYKSGVIGAELAPVVLHPIDDILRAAGDRRHITLTHSGAGNVDQAFFLGHSCRGVKNSLVVGVRPIGAVQGCYNADFFCRVA
jgi:hypothetical protein